jgi:DNA-binding MarR family transcriptional regulator
MDDDHNGSDSHRPESSNSLEPLGGSAMRAVGAAPVTAPPPQDVAHNPEDDCWEALIEFALSRRAWWIDICAGFDLTPMQGHTLRSLDPDRPVAMSVLADQLICDASNVTGIIDKLESRGLILRQSSESDRRIKMLAITPKGRELRDRLAARLLVAPPALAATPPEFRRQLATVLRAIVAEQAAAVAPSTKQ